ncbi:MAG TPA: hypothetical protein VKM55_24605 [Candidatus Lokiarchaeia archaeon]|nr:hypothetical protein [Candidatus Lokiarchaeia archaeon]
MSSTLMMLGTGTRIFAGTPSCFAAFCFDFVTIVITCLLVRAGSMSRLFMSIHVIKYWHGGRGLARSLNL